MDLTPENKAGMGKEEQKEKQVGCGGGLNGENNDKTNS